MNARRNNRPARAESADGPAVRERVGEGESERRPGLDGWEMLLFAAASLWATRMLVSLMLRHRAQYTRQLITEERFRRKAEKSRQRRQQRKPAA